MKNEPEINVIMVGKLNYMENDAELDGQWSNLMVKVRFYEEQVTRSVNNFVLMHFFAFLRKVTRSVNIFSDTFFDFGEKVTGWKIARTD